MKPYYSILCLILFWTTGIAFCAEQYPDRWFYASFGIQNEAEVEEMLGLLQTAHEKDLNGMLWACGLDTYDHWKPAAKERLAVIKKKADELNIEIIPLVWSVGYGKVRSLYPHLVEGGKVSGLPMTVKGGRLIYFNASLPLFCPNGGMEEVKNNKLVGMSHDDPGTISFVDNEVKHSGNSSIRLENFTANSSGHGRMTVPLKLNPNREYSVRIWYKSEKLQGGDFMFMVHQAKGGRLAIIDPEKPVNGTTDWKEERFTFNSGDGDVRLYAGLWGGVAGKIWFDDLTITEMGLVNPLRRPGTPLVVKNADTQKIYQEGKDYTLPEYKINFVQPDEKGISLNVPKGSNLKEGDSVLVDYYAPVIVYGKQVSACMSEPALYEYFRESAQTIQKILAPKKWFLNMDEIRAAGSCAACQERKISLAEILADSITKQHAIIREIQPQAEIYIWSDMLDPKHNAKANYYACVGDYTGVWNLIPKDLIISCWHYRQREDSTSFFSQLGFRTQAAAYYDKDDLKNTEDWIETCNHTPLCTGIMYTTWNHKYKLLSQFGDLVREKGKPLKTDQSSTNK